MGVRDIRYRFADFCRLSPSPVLLFFIAMINNINNFGVINFYENNSESKKDQAKPQVEDITPSEDSSFASDNLSDFSDSIIFTKKAKKEAKQAAVIEALKKSVQGRRDKTRAFVDELHSWQNDGYVDAHYNAQVMYDELRKLLPISFGYEVFKKHYNNTRS